MLALLNHGLMQSSWNSCAQPSFTPLPAFSWQTAHSDDSEAVLSSLLYFYSSTGVWLFSLPASPKSLKMEMGGIGRKGIVKVV